VSWLLAAAAAGLSALGSSALGRGRGAGARGGGRGRAAREARGTRHEATQNTAALSSTSTPTAIQATGNSSRQPPHAPPAGDWPGGVRARARDSVAAPASWVLEFGIIELSCFYVAQKAA
jgi:hypothetical protein